MDVNPILIPFLPFAVGAIAVVVWGIVAVFRGWLRHTERMAMISEGLHPDDPALQPGEKDRDVSAVVSPGRPSVG